MKNFEKESEMPMAAQNAKKLLEKYLEYIKGLGQEKKGNTSVLANEQIRLGRSQDLQTPEEISAFVGELLSKLESGDHEPAMKFIGARIFNANADSVLSAEDNWEKVLAELEEQYGKIKPIEKEVSEAFKEKVLNFFKKAPDTGSDVETYLKNNDVPQLLGYLRGFHKDWLDGYLSFHPKVNETSLQTLVQDAQKLLEELKTIAKNLPQKQEYKNEL